MLIYPPTSTLKIGWARMRRSRVGKTVKVITRGQGKCATAPFKRRNEVAKNTNSCYNIKLRKVFLIDIGKTYARQGVTSLISLEWKL